MERLKGYQGKKVLITGGLGFIGSSLALALHELGSEVIMVDSSLEGHGANVLHVKPIQEDIEVHMTDIRNAEVMLTLVKGVDIIFHLAAHTDVEASIARPFTDIDINCVGSMILLLSCRRNNPGVRVIYAGTKDEYGPRAQTEVTEQHPLNPDSVYAVNRLTAEMYHRVYHQLGAINYTGLRLGNIYGPRAQDSHRGSGRLNWLILRAMEDTEFVLPFDSASLVDYCYIDDVVEAFLIAGIHPDTAGKTYNIGGEAISWVELIRMVIDAAQKGKIKEASDGQGAEGLKSELILDYSSFQRDTGWLPKTGLNEGLKRTIEYYGQG